MFVGANNDILCLFFAVNFFPRTYIFEVLLSKVQGDGAEVTLALTVDRTGITPLGRGGDLGVGFRHKTGDSHKTRMYIRPHP